MKRTITTALVAALAISANSSFASSAQASTPRERSLAKQVRTLKAQRTALRKERNTARANAAALRLERDSLKSQVTTAQGERDSALAQVAAAQANAQAANQQRDAAQADLAIAQQGAAQAASTMTPRQLTDTMFPTIKTVFDNWHGGYNPGQLTADATYSYSHTLGGYESWTYYFDLTKWE